MKLLTVIIFKNSDAFDVLNGKVCEKLSFEHNKAFPGCWDIVDNRENVINMISETINYFIDTSEKEAIVFGCCMKDYNDIMRRINTEKCEINCTYAEVFLI